MGEALDPDLVRRALRRKRYEAVALVHNETSDRRHEPARRDRARGARGERRAAAGRHRLVARRHAGRDRRVGPRRGARRHPEGAGAASRAHRLHALARAPPSAPAAWRGAASTPTSCAIATSTARAARSPRPRVSLLLRPRPAARPHRSPRAWRRAGRGTSALQRRTAAWAAEHGFDFAPAPDARSWTVSCLRPPAGLAAPEIVQRLGERGFIVGGGYGDWKTTHLPHRPHGRGARARSRGAARRARGGGGGVHRILIADPLDPPGLEILRASGAEVHEASAEERQRLPELMPDFDALVVRSMTQVDRRPARAPAAASKSWAAPASASTTSTSRRRPSSASWWSTPPPPTSSRPPSTPSRCSWRWRARCRPPTPS